MLKKSNSEVLNNFDTLTLTKPAFTDGLVWPRFLWWLFLLLDKRTMLFWTVFKHFHNKNDLTKLTASCITKQNCSTGCTSTISAVICLHFGTLQCGSNIRQLFGSIFLSVSTSQYLIQLWSYCSHNDRKFIHKMKRQKNLNQSLLCSLNIVITFWISWLCLSKDMSLFLLGAKYRDRYRIIKMSFSFYLSPIKWWTRSDLSRAGYRQMRHNSEGQETQRKSEHSLERPTDLLLWSTEGKIYKCMCVCLLFGACQSSQIVFVGLYNTVITFPPQWVIK